MKLTENEARERWCPFSRIAGGAGATNASINRTTGIDLHPGTKYLGSACMAWRWYNDPDDGSKRRGYCGMVDKP